MAKWKFPGPTSNGDADVKAFGDHYKNLSNSYITAQNAGTDLADAMFEALEDGIAENDSGDRVTDDNGANKHHILFVGGSGEKILTLVKPEAGFPDTDYLEPFVQYCQLDGAGAPTMEDKTKALHGMMLLSKCR